MHSKLLSKHLKLFKFTKLYHSSTAKQWAKNEMLGCVALSEIKIVMVSGNLSQTCLLDSFYLTRLQQ